MYPIKKMTKADILFPTKTMEMMPAYKDIPEDFPNRAKYARAITLWFFQGADGMKFTPREGVNEMEALAHIACIINSFEPKHEHKVAGCAWLLNEWFIEVK